MENIISTEMIYWSIYTRASLLVFLSVASYFDKKEFRIPNKLNLGFLAVRLLLIPLIGLNLGSLYGAIIGLLLVLIPAMIINKPMGGDIKLLAVSGLFLGAQNILILLGGTILAGIVPAVIVKKSSKERKDIPLAPFVLISFILMNIISFSI